MSTTEEVKGRLDIVDVASSYVQLQKAGRNFKAACPFHQEKTPSFFIFPERQSWHCFGACGTGGDVFSLVMKAENIDFGEALRRLAQRAGVTLTRRGQDKEGTEAKERLYQVNELAVSFYHRFLLESSEAAGVREYLGRRGVIDDGIEQFQLGCSPTGWEGLCGYLLRQGVSEADQSAAGLLVKGERGRYDRFRGRLMFPVRDQQGRVCGFGARALGDDTPKYTNTPQTPIYDKSGLLYGLDLAQEAIKGEGLAVVVEGYMDVIAAHQVGIRNVVASMGTAITERQMRLLQRHTKRVALALDADAAGQAATRRGLEVARSAGARQERSFASWLAASATLESELRVFALPPGKDPDDVIKESPAAWQELVRQSKPGLDYLFDVTTEELDLSQPRGRSAAAERLIPLIAELGDPVQRELYLGRLSRLVGVSERTLQGMAIRLEQSKSKEKRGQPSPTEEASKGSVLRDRLEEHTLTLLLKNPECREAAHDLSPSHFEHVENRELFLVWQQNPSLEGLRKGLDEALEEQLEAILAVRLLPGAAERALADCIRRLEERRLRRLMEQGTELIAEAEASGDPSELETLVYTLLQANAESEDAPDEAARQAALRRRGVEIAALLGQTFARAARKGTPKQR